MQKIKLTRMSNIDGNIVKMAELDFVSLIHLNLGWFSSSLFMA